MVYSIWGGLCRSFTTSIVHSNLDFLCRSAIPENGDLSTRFVFFVFSLQLHHQDESPQRTCWTVLTHAWLTSSDSSCADSRPPQSHAAWAHCRFHSAGMGPGLWGPGQLKFQTQHTGSPSQQTWWRALLWSSLCNTRPATELQQWMKAKARVQAEAKNNFTALADPSVE